MEPGIRATVEFPTAPCPIARLARDTGTSVDRTWTSVAGDGATGSVTAFAIDVDDPPPPFTHVMALGDRHLLRIDHGENGGCPCTILGEHGLPVQRYVADEGTLRLVFTARDYGELQSAVTALRSAHPDIDVRRLVRAPVDGEETDPIFVDRSRLTARQLEVLETAYQRGYFERPRHANATELSAHLGIDPTTFSEHLAAALSKLLGDVLETGPTVRV